MRESGIGTKGEKGGGEICGERGVEREGEGVRWI